MLTELESVSAVELPSNISYSIISQLTVSLGWIWSSVVQNLKVCTPINLCLDYSILWVDLISFIFRRSQSADIWMRNRFYPGIYGPGQVCTCAFNKNPPPTVANFVTLSVYLATFKTKEIFFGRDRNQQVRLLKDGGSTRNLHPYSIFKTI